MRIGRMALEQRVDGEVAYHDARGRTVQARFGPNAGDTVPLAYARAIAIMDAHGGWIASAVDMVRFASAFDDPERCPILSAAGIDTMFARPEGALGLDEEGKPKPAYYACGWLVRPKRAGRANTWHTGGIVGTSTLMVRRHDGLNWVVLFNTDASPDGKALSRLIDHPLHGAANAVTAWPDIDLFPAFLDPPARP
jgi:N-acyl-D-amino-acid deacylase